MKILFKIISAFLYFNAVSPVLMYYIYDDNPNIGFMALDNGIGAYVKTGFSVNSKKQFTGSYNPKYQKINNEHVVDSHFKVMKTPSRYSPSTAVVVDNARLRGHEAGKSNAKRIVEEYRNTEAPKQWQQRTQHQQPSNTAISGPQEPQNTQTPNNPSVRVDYANAQEAAPHNQPSNNQPISPIRPKTDYSQLKQRSQKKQKQEGVFDPKPSFVQMNVRKTQISTDPQKIVRLNNNRQLTSLSVHTSQEKRQRLPTSLMMDKTLHKANGLHEHNMEIMSRVLDDMTQKIADRRHKGEFRKRDTTKTLDLFEKSKRSVVSDNMRKYIGKDKTIGTHRAMDVARIGSREESLEVNETPYALFYRMNPETLDQQEGFMIMRSVEENTNTSRDFASKEKRLTSSLEDKTKKRQQKSKKNGSTLKLRKKLKNFSNYRSH
ncbi:hypothetical protein B5X24_HaOG208891 [Helicoverpa armigera]|nr:hypothetical protein B5X24_HaOG208891 [Helicoverpa armigera]